MLITLIIISVLLVLVLGAITAAFIALIRINVSFRKVHTLIRKTIPTVEEAASTHRAIGESQVAMAQAYMSFRDQFGEAIDDLAAIIKKIPDREEHANKLLEGMSKIGLDLIVTMREMDSTLQTWTKLTFGTDKPRDTGFAAVAANDEINTIMRENELSRPEAEAEYQRQSAYQNMRITE